MAEEKGKVVLFGTRLSGRATVAKMLVSGELRDCSWEPTNSISDCETYVGRGWTVVDTMGFGEPLGGMVPDEYVTKMVIDCLNEVKGRYSHIVFVVDRADFPFYSVDDSSPIPFMWRTFLETFKGGEGNFVVLVTNETPARPMRMFEQNELDAGIKKTFPECKHFLFTDFGNPDPEKFSNDDQAVLKIEALERFEKEMEEMFTAANRAWVEPEISKMGDAEIQETATRISRHLTSSPALEPQHWEWDQPRIQLESYEDVKPGIRDLKRNARWVLRVQDEMQNLGKEVKFFPHQCAYLLQRSMGASKELQDLVDGRIEAIWNNYDHDEAPLLSCLKRLVSCTQAAKELLQLCVNKEKEHEVALTLSSRPLPDSQVSKFALVIRDLEWSLDAFLFVFHNPEVQRASLGENERQSLLSKFVWCESRGRLVYVKDGEDNDDVESSTVAADNDRQAQDQRDLVSAMESHFKTLANPETIVSSLSIFLKKKITTKQLSSSEVANYMSILKNRLQGDASFDGDSSTMTVPECFRIPGKQEYKAGQLLGEGSYKAVHKCNWLGMNVAIATESQPNGHSDQGGEDSKTVLEAEAGLLARVQHPNVVTFLGYSYDKENRRGSQVSEIMESNLRSLINKHYRSD